MTHNNHDTQPMVTEALLPCPSGHDRAALDYDGEFEAFFVHCEAPLCNWRMWHDNDAEAIAAWNKRDCTQQTTRSDDPHPGYAPCPTCHQYSHSLGDDALAKAFNHFQAMTDHRGDGSPTQHVFDEETRDAAQVLMAAARSADGGLREVLEDTEATLYAVKAEALVDGGGTCLWIAEKVNDQMIANRAILGPARQALSRGK